MNEKMVGNKEYVKELQNAGDYLTIRGIRGGAIGSIFFGILAIFMGYNSIDIDPINIVLLFLGIFLIVEGFYVIASPSLGGFILEGTALCSIGFWNIIISIMNLYSSGGYSGISIFFLLGCLQIYLGVKSLLRFIKYNKRDIHKPTDDLLKEVKKLVNSTIKANPKVEPDVLIFNVSAVFTPEIWRSKLMGDIGLFVTQDKSTVIFANKNDVSFVDNGKNRSLKQLPVSISIGRHNFKGVMPAESYARYESWKYSSVNSSLMTNTHEKIGYCPMCGVKLQDKSNFCWECGTNLLKVNNHL